MMHIVTMISIVLVVGSGVYVMACGEWGKFGLKFAGVVLSTVAAIGLITAEALMGGGVISCPADMSGHMCLSFELYHVVRNLAFVIFHIATGRDAILFKKRDRRGASWQTQISSKPSLRS